MYICQGLLREKCPQKQVSVSGGSAFGKMPCLCGAVASRTDREFTSTVLDVNGNTTTLQRSAARRGKVAMEHIP